MITTKYLKFNMNLSASQSFLNFFSYKEAFDKIIA